MILNIIYEIKYKLIRISFIFLLQIYFSSSYFSNLKLFPDNSVVEIISILFIFVSNYYF